MFTLSTYLTRTKAAVVAFAVFLPGIALGQAQPSTTFDKNGTLHIAGYQLPQSELVSDEFKMAYAQHLIDSKSWPMLAPPVNAPRAEWDRFDAESNRLIFGPSVKWAEEHLPVDIVETKMAGVSVGIITPQNGIDPRNEYRVLINLHGGGFTMGRSLVAGKGESIPVAAVGCIKVVTVDYRMVPYASYPAASEDVEAVYRELSDRPLMCRHQPNCRLPRPRRAFPRAPWII
jgi:monoterpene epsilon-lactone hydrolase